MATKLENSSQETKNAIRDIVNGVKALTVGVSGKYATIQAALDYIATQPAFIAIPMTQDGSISSWAQSTDTFELTTKAQTPIMSQFTIPYPIEKVWFKVAGDAYYYPISDEVNGGALTQSIKSIRRVEASISSETALTWWQANEFTIKLVDGYYYESFSLNTNMFVTFKGLGSNVLQMNLAKSASFKSGRIAFNDVVVGAGGLGGAIHWASTELNTIDLSVYDATISSVQDDFIFPSVVFGSIDINRTRIIQNPTAEQGHTITAHKVFGDIRLSAIIWDVFGHSVTNAALNNTCMLVDLTTNCRNVFISGVDAIIHDEFTAFEQISICGSTARNFDAENVYVNGVTLICNDATAANFSVYLTALGHSVVSNWYMDNISFVIPNGTGTKKLVQCPDGAPAGTINVNIGNNLNVLECDVHASVLPVMTPPEHGGISAATGVHTIVHGLGYAPDISSIQLTLGASNVALTHFYVAGVVGGQFNIITNDFAHPSTFYWNIQR